MQFRDVQRWVVSGLIQLLSSVLRAPGSLPSFACSLTAIRSQNGCLSSRHHIPFPGKKEEVDRASNPSSCACLTENKIPEASIQSSLKSNLLELFHKAAPASWEILGK